MSPNLVLPARLAPHPRAYRLDQTDFLGDRNELIRRYQAQLGMPPADQGLCADDPPGIRIALRLIVEKKRVAWQRPA